VLVAIFGFAFAKSPGYRRCRWGALAPWKGDVDHNGIALIGAIFMKYQVWSQAEHESK